MLLTELLTKGYVDKYTWKNTGSGYYLATVKSELDEVLADAGIESFMRIDEAGLGLVKSGYSRELFLTRFFANYDGPIAMQELDGGKVRFIDMQETANIHSLMGADLPFSPRIKAGHWSDILLVDGVAVEVPSILKQVITKLWFGKGISIDVKDIDADERTIANQYQKLMDKLIALGLIVPRNYIYKARGKLVFYYPNFSLRGSKPRYSEVEA